MKTINLGRGEGEVVIRPSLGHFLMYVNLFSGVVLMTNIVIKLNPFGIYEITCFPWQPIMKL